MKRFMMTVVVACLMASISQAARQGQANNAGQRRFFKFSIPSEQKPRLLLPSGNTIELSALKMERDSGSMMHLEGGVEIKTFWPGSNSVPLALLRAEGATYNLNTGEIAVSGKMSVVLEERK